MMMFGTAARTCTPTRALAASAPGGPGRDREAHREKPAFGRGVVTFLRRARKATDKLGHVHRTNLERVDRLARDDVELLKSLWPASSAAAAKAKESETRRPLDEAGDLQEEVVDALVWEADADIDE